MEASQVVLVTGGGRGIGRAIARRFAAGGARVAVVAGTGAEIEEVAAGIDPAGIRALAVPTDVTDEGQVRALFCQVVKKFGRLDVLVNSAGVCILGPVTEFRSEDWDYQMQVNVKGVFLCTREALKYMIPRGRGDIVNLASYMGLRGGATVSAYCASKHAVVGFGRAVAEWDGRNRGGAPSKLATPCKGVPARSAAAASLGRVGRCAGASRRVGQTARSR